MAIAASCSNRRSILIRCRAKSIQVRDVRTTNILGENEPRVLTKILPSGTAMIIFNVADFTLREVAAVSWHADSATLKSRSPP